jgi:coenzyme PQQ precursor peptide PqqA
VEKIRWQWAPSDAKQAPEQCRNLFRVRKRLRRTHRNTLMEAEADMTWTTPVITEICVGMEVTSYLSAEI